MLSDPSPLNIPFPLWIVTVQSHLCSPHLPKGNATLSPLWKDLSQYLEGEITLPVGVLLHPIQPC